MRPRDSSGVPGAIGAQLSVTILTASGTPPTERGYVMAVSTFAVLALVGVTAATIIPAGRRVEVTQPV
jgi:hypothetical protein